MALSIFGDRSAPLARLKRGDFSSQEELVQLFKTLDSVSDLEVEHLSWLFSETRRDLRAVGLQYLLRRNLPGTFQAIMVHAFDTKDAALQRTLLGLLPNVAIDDGVDLLVRLIRGGHSEQQVAAVEGLLLFPWERIEPHLVDLARHPDGKIRQRAMTKLAAMVDEDNPPSEAIREILQGRVKDTNIHVRSRALELLAAWPDETFLETVLTGLTEEPAEIQERLVAVLDQCRFDRLEAGMEAVFPLLFHGEERICRAAMKLVARSGEADQAMAMILARCEGQMGWMQARIHHLLDEEGEALLKTLKALMGDEDPEVRTRAIRFALRHPHEELTEACVSLLGDPDWWVRLLAVEALAGLGSEAVLQPLIGALEDPDVRWAAVHALGRVGTIGVLEPLARVVANAPDEVRLEVVRAVVQVGDVRVAPLLVRMVEGDPSLRLRRAAFDGLRALKADDGQGVDLASLRRSVPRAGDDPDLLERLLLQVRQAGGDRLYLTPDAVPMMRVAGGLSEFPDMAPLSFDALREQIGEVLPDRAREQLASGRSVEVPLDIAGLGRHRLAVAREVRGPVAVAHVLPNEVSSLAALRVPGPVLEALEHGAGLVLLAGPSASGADDTLAAMVDHINEGFTRHIVTVEDPVQYQHIDKRGLVHQCQVGSHCDTHADGVLGALRTDADVIVVDAVTDADTALATLEAAESGHLVIARVPVSGVLKALARFIQWFPRERRALERRRLARYLRLVVGQHRLPRFGGDGVVHCYEILAISEAVRHLIDEQKLVLVGSLMAQGRPLGVQTLDDALLGLLEEGLIGPDVAHARAANKQRFASIAAEGEVASDD